jgi:GNAT superfamily N-acetyltransferase
MLVPAHVGHLAMLRTLIRQSAAEGSFESNLATDTPKSVDFFDKLKRALAHGYFAEEDPKTGHVAAVAVPGYVFWPDDRNGGDAPVGFGLFRALEGGYELWLAGLEFGRRGDGHGRALIDALFATSHGKKTWVVRIPRGSRYRAAVHHLLQPHGFAPVGDTKLMRWFLRADAPQSLKTRIRDMVGSRPSFN